MLQALKNYKLNLNIYIIEEEELYKNISYPLPDNVIEVVFGSYQQSMDFFEPAKTLSERVKFSAVIPGVEYAVTGAYELAAYLDLPCISSIGAHVFTDKANMRNACENINIPQPKYKLVSAVEEVEEFYDGKPIIIKPTNIQASIGVIKVFNEQDIKLSWKESTSSVDVIRNISRKQIHNYLVEEIIEGDEYSVEAIVSGGEIKFINISNTLTNTGSKNSVETGHIVPAIIIEKLKESIIYYHQILVEGLKVKDTFLHSEWIVDKLTGLPMLIECAGRVPGGLIMEMIEKSYNFNPYHALVDCLSNERDIEFNNNPNSGTALMFFQPLKGKFLEVTNSRLLKENQYICDWEINAKQGKELDVIKSAWDRIGHVMLNCSSSNHAYEELENIMYELEVKVADSKEIDFESSS